MERIGFLLNEGKVGYRIATQMRHYAVAYYFNSSKKKAQKRKLAFLF
jgi:hypothetical protein